MRTKNLLTPNLGETATDLRHDHRPTISQMQFFPYDTVLFRENLQKRIFFCGHRTGPGQSASAFAPAAAPSDGNR